MRKIILLLFLATAFFACKTDPGSSDSTDTSPKKWKVTIDSKTAPGLSNYNLSVEDGKPISSQLTQTPNNPFDFITSNTTYQSGDAYITGYRDQDGKIYDAATTPVTKDITVSVEWGFKNYTDDVCKGKNADNPPSAYVIPSTADFAGLYCNTKEQGNLDKLYSGSTFLVLAARNGLIDFVKYLIIRGADINRAEQIGDTPLINAAGYSQYEIVKYLGDNGAKLDVKGDRGYTALIQVCNSTNSDANYNIVKYLVDKGANVNLQDDFGYTALMSAASAGYSLRITQYLVENGKADLSIKNNDGKTALALANGTIYTYLSGLTTTP